MAGYPTENFPKEVPNGGLANFYPFHSEEMKPILDIIKRKRNSLEVKFEEVR